MHQFRPRVCLTKNFYTSVSNIYMWVNMNADEILKMVREELDKYLATFLNSGIFDIERFFTNRENLEDIGTILGGILMYNSIEEGRDVVESYINTSDLFFSAESGIITKINDNEHDLNDLKKDIKIIYDDKLNIIKTDKSFDPCNYNSLLLVKIEFFRDFLPPIGNSSADERIELKITFNRWKKPSLDEWLNS